MFSRSHTHSELIESFRLLGLGGATIRAPRSTYLVGYLASSLVTNMVLTSLIIFRLLLCKSQAENILGASHVKHYNFLLILFIESAFMNFLCSVLLLSPMARITSTAAQTYIMDDLYENTDFFVCDTIMQIMLAITPPIQVSSTPSNASHCHWLYINYQGVLELFDCLQRN